MNPTPRLTMITLFILGLTAMSHADDKKEKVFYLNAKSAADCSGDFAVQGEYLGTIGKETKVGAQVIALSDGKFDAVLYDKGLPGAGWSGALKVRLTGQRDGDTTNFTGKNFSGTIVGELFSGQAEDDVKFEMKKVERRSSTLGAKPPEGAIVLFDGNNVDSWQAGKLEEGNLLGVPARTKQSFGNFTLHLEFRTPFMPYERGQGRGNSGMYLLDQYECQVLDSFGLRGENNECGGIYKIAKPKVNMCLPPLSWQTYDVEFTAAAFNSDGKKTADAVTTIRHNGVVIHDKLQLPKITPGGGRSDERPGPLYLQHHGDRVHYRNIWVAENK